MIIEFEQKVLQKLMDREETKAQLNSTNPQAKEKTETNNPLRVKSTSIVQSNPNLCSRQSFISYVPKIACKLLTDKLVSASSCTKPVVNHANINDIQQEKKFNQNI